MYRQLILSTGALSITQQTTASVQLTRSLSSRTNNPNQKGAADVAFIKEWLASFTNNVKAIPSSILDIKHARSRHGNDKLAYINPL